MVYYKNITMDKFLSSFHCLITIYYQWIAEDLVGGWKRFKYGKASITVRVAERHS